MPHILNWRVAAFAAIAIAMLTGSAAGQPDEESGAKGIACPTIYEPVCGSDGRTYANACEARRAGASVDRPGTCRSEDDLPCPQIHQPVCGVDGKTYGNACIARNAGVEVDRRGPCEETGSGPCPDVYRPVCGVDGKTYGNACEARQAGVRVRRRGRCPDPGTACGGIAGVPCGGGQYCFMATGKCRIPDWQGHCRNRPDFCTEHYLPVCGCDGETYPNACSAASAGVNILHKGRCQSGRR